MHFIRKMKKGQDEISLKFCSDRYWWPRVVGSRSPSLSFSDPELLSNRPKHTMYSEKLLRKSPTFQAHKLLKQALVNIIRNIEAYFCLLVHKYIINFYGSQIL